MSLYGCIWNFSFKSSLGSSSAAYHPRWSPYREMLPTYNQLAASSLLNQQYNAALGLGKVHDVVDKSDWEVLFYSPELYYFVSRVCAHQDFMASQQEELPWLSRLSRLCQWPVLPRKGGTHYPNNRADGLSVQPRDLARVFHRFRRRIYPPVSIVAHKYKNFSLHLFSNSSKKTFTSVKAGHRLSQVQARHKAKLLGTRNKSKTKVLK